MVLKEMLERFREKRLALKQMKDQDRNQEMVQELKKSPNERELDEFLNEEREQKIKFELERFKNRQKIKDRKDNLMKAKNIFANQGSIMKDNKRLFSMSMDNMGGSFNFHGR